MLDNGNLEETSKSKMRLRSVILGELGSLRNEADQQLELFQRSEPCNSIMICVMMADTCTAIIVFVHS